jgi:cytochrome d ubiquinol oxidase subunit I
MEILLARIQFAATSTYHFFFVPLTLGLVLLVAIIQTRYVQTGDEKFKKMTKFWGNLFLINFAMGVVTGIVQEFQFGMNWSGYSRYVGDIFGAPLAVEALLAFFIESTFIGIWVFGWERLGKKAHLTCIWLVAIASNLSAVWILIANSFMQNPLGYEIANGRAQMIDFPALITNPHFLYQFPHVFSAGLCTGAFFIMGVSAWHLFKGSDIDFFKTSFKYGATAGFIAVILVVGIGHFQGQHLVQEQPMKMAAAEAHWETADPADFVIFAGIDEKNRANSAEIKIPGLLSFMSYNSFTGEVKGLNDLQAEMEARHGPGNYTPPVAVNFWSFRVMVGAGLLMLLLALLALIFRGNIDKR